MDIRTIRTFIQVAEQNSFTKAAEELNYVQSTVTMQIQQLEKELGYPLFDRIGKKISLTSSGTEFLAYAYEIHQAMEKAETLGKSTAHIPGILRLGASESILFGPILDLLPSFKEAFPLLDLRIKTGHNMGLLDQLKQNQLDMVYLSAAPNTDPDLRCHYMRRESMIFLGSPSHPLAGKRRIPFAELMTFEFLLTEREGICVTRLKELSARYHTALNASVEIDSIYMITELVQQGLGLAFLPEYAVRKKLEDGLLCKLDVDLPPQVYYTQVLCHKNKWISPFMAGLLDQIEKLYPAS